MLKNIRTYKKLYISSFLSLYLLGGFQVSMLECLHFITHIDDLVSGNYQTHDYQDHGGEHVHAGLDLFKGIQIATPTEKVPMQNALEDLLNETPQALFGQSLCLFDRFIMYRASTHSSLLLAYLPLDLPVPPPRI